MKKILKILLPLLILAAGFLVARHLILNRPQPARVKTETAGILVEVMPAVQRETEISVRGYGTVRPAREITVAPQVNGRVTEVNPQLVAGGLLSAGELLFALEREDYRLAMIQAESGVARAESALAQLEGRARVARLEWERLRRDEQPDPLVLLKPQLQEAGANLEAARAAFSRAELDLARTRLEAPFNALVRNEQVDTGQYVRAGTGVVTLAGIDTAEIVVPLALEELHWLTIPELAGNGDGSPATVRFGVDGRDYELPARVDRSLGEVDSQGRMARLVVTVRHPYGWKGKKTARPDLRFGMFVEVEMQGPQLHGVVELPRRALRENGTVWIMDAADTLRIRKVEIVRRRPETVLVSKGLPEGERVVLSNIQGGAAGMRLRAASGGEGT